MKIVNESDEENSKNISIFADTSDMLEDVGYAEKIVMNKEFLSNIVILKKMKKGHKIKDTFSLTEKDIKKYTGDDNIPKMNSVAYKMNQAFSAMSIPYRARFCETEKTIHVYRYGDEFKDYKTYIPTEGMKMRTLRWIDENGDEIFDVLKKLGMDIERMG